MESSSEFRIRQFREEDWSFLAPQLNGWWGGRQVSQYFQHLFATHFANTSFTAESTTHGGKSSSSSSSSPSNTTQIVGFICGFASPAKKGHAYIHFVGVDPAFRKQGLARQLYSRFFELIKAEPFHCHTVNCITAPVNKTSIGFHKAMGFSLLHGDGIDASDGSSYFRDYEGPGQDRVIFEKRI
eukprot:ANDGO_03075.mRNA.1 Uncharacterized protein YqjY